MLHPQAVLEPMKRSAETSEHGRRNSTRVGTDGLSFVRLQRSAVLIPFTLGPLEEDKLSGNLSSTTANEHIPPRLRQPSSFSFAVVPERHEELIRIY